MNYEKKLRVPSKTFLKYKDNIINMGTYYRIREDGTIELGYGMPINAEETYNNRDIYDNVRLLINPQPLYIEGHEVFRCRVIWFNSSNTIYIPKGEKYDDSFRSQEEIIVQLDKRLLFTDKKYYSFLMEKLLEKNRVEKYIRAGEQEDSKIKCGKYIGEVRYDEHGKLIKSFQSAIGKNCHYSEEMKKLRESRKKAAERIHKKKITDLNEQIKQLQEKRNQLIEQEPYINGRKNK